VRSDVELNDELTSLYGLPIDIAAKAGGLATIARALNRGNLVLAKIAAVQMQFPDPPLFAKRSESLEDLARRAAELYRSSLLKADEDWEAKHPRAGTKPNPGWFAPVPKEPKLPSKSGWPIPAINAKIREAVEKIAAKLAPLGLGPVGEALFIAAEIVDVMEGIKKVFTIEQLNQGEDRLVAQMKANFDPPKTFDELQKPPTENALGYEKHHIVEQTDDNIAKSNISAPILVEKFGREKIEDPSNIVWVPRLKHEAISGYYSSKPGGPGTPTVREEQSKLDFDAQRAAGLEQLRKQGVLK